MARRHSSLMLETMAGKGVIIPCKLLKRIFSRGVAQPGLRRMHGVHENGGSNPLTPTKNSWVHACPP